MSQKKILATPHDMYAMQFLCSKSNTVSTKTMIHTAQQSITIKNQLLVVVDNFNTVYFLCPTFHLTPTKLQSIEPDLIVTQLGVAQLPGGTHLGQHASLHLDLFCCNYSRSPIRLQPLGHTGSHLLTNNNIHKDCTTYNAAIQPDWFQAYLRITIFINVAQLLYQGKKVFVKLHFS